PGRGARILRGCAVGCSPFVVLGVGIGFGIGPAIAPCACSRRGPWRLSQTQRRKPMTTKPTAPLPISERLREYLRDFSPLVGLTPETITADQVPRWERVAAMVRRVHARALRREAQGSSSGGTVRRPGPRGQ